MSVTYLKKFNGVSIYVLSEWCLNQWCIIDEFFFFFRQMDDITLDEIDDLEVNLMDDMKLDEIRSTVHPEKVRNVS